MTTRRHAIHRSRRRGGFSLLEVVLSIAIMGVAMAALSSVVMTGADAALDAKDRTMAQILCEHQLAQVVLNNVTPTPYTDQSLNVGDTSTAYTATLETQQGPIQGILALRMTVKAQPSDGSRPPVAVAMVRWMVDPILALEQLEAEEKAAAEEAAAAEDAASSEGGL